MQIIRAMIYTLAAFGILFFALKKKNSKPLFRAAMAFCWVVIALCLDSHDIFNYRNAYNHLIARGRDPFFDFFQITIAKTGLPFDLFKIIYGTLTWLLLYRALGLYTEDTALIAALFAIGPMMGFGTQMRSSMAGVIMLNALPFLLHGKKDVWKYCLLLTVASLFHIMALFYFIFLIPIFFQTDSTRFRNIMLGFALLLLVVFVVFAKSISVLLISIQKYIPSSSVQSILSRFARYLSGEMSPNIKGFLFGSGGHIVSFFLADKMCEIMLDLRKNHALPQQKKYLSSSTISFLRNLNSLMVLIVPCYALSLQFDRFFAYFVPVAYSLIVQGICELKLSREHHAGWFQNSASCNIQGVRTHMYSLDAEYMRSIALFLLLSCLTFCFLVSNWYSGFSEFSRIVTGIARFGGL